MWNIVYQSEGKNEYTNHGKTKQTKLSMLFLIGRSMNNSLETALHDCFRLTYHIYRLQVQLVEALNTNRGHA